MHGWGVQWIKRQLPESGSTSSTLDSSAASSSESMSNVELDIDQVRDLDAKELSSLLSSTSATLVPSLRQFAQDVYAQLHTANRDLAAADGRAEHMRRLEALSRVLVGDEVCGAVTVHDGRLLLASNCSGLHDVDVPHDEVQLELEWRLINTMVPNTPK